MLERGSACLQRGALRRLAKASTCSSSTRRTLHSSFWIHGAGQLDLALSALSEAVGLKKADSTSRYNARADTVTGLAGTFLDFLYPSKTLAMIRTYSIQPKVLSDRLKSKGSRKAQRPYSSIASDTINSSSSEHKQNVYSRNQSKSAGKRYAPLDLQRMRASLSTAVSGHNELTEADFDEAWREYKQQSNLDTKDMQRILNELAKSRRQIDAERLLQVYNDIPPLLRTTADYQNAAFAYVRVEEFTGVFSVLREAQKQEDAHILIDNVTAKALDVKRWDVAFEVWSTGRSSTSKEWNFLEWKDNQHCDILCERACLLFAASPNALSAHWTLAHKDFRLQWQIFQQAVACSALKFGSQSTNTKAVLDLFGHLKGGKFNLSKLYSRWIGNFFDLGDDSNGLRLYMRARAVMFVSKAKHLKLQIPLGLLHYLLRVASRLDNIRATHFIYEDLFQFYDGPDLMDSQLMLKAFAKHRDVESVQKLADYVFKTYGPPTDCVVLSSLLHVHAQRRDLAKTRAVFESISSKYGLEPNIVCYNILIRACAREDDANSALEIFNRLVKKSASAVDGSADLTPDIYTYGTLMGAYAQRGDIARVDDFYRMAREQGLQETTAMIDCLVLARIRSGNILDATKLVNEATQDESRRSLTTMWNYIILGHVFNHDLRGMKDTYDRMQKAGVKFNSMTYAALIQGLVFARRFDHAIRVLWKIMPMAGIQPVAFHHGILMIGLVRAQKNPFALFIFEKMVSRGIKPNATTQVQMLKAAANVEYFLSDPDSVPTGKIPDHSVAHKFIGDGPSQTKFKNPLPPSFAEPQQSRDSPSPKIAFLEQLMHRHAALGHVDRVNELKTKWTLEMKRLYPDGQPPLPFGVIWNLMRSNVKVANREEADKYWGQLIAHVKREAAAFGHDVSKPGWVPPPQKTRLCVPLSHQMRSLARRKKLNELVDTVNELRQDGFVLNNLNTNIYIEILSQTKSPHLIQLAFEACEQNLMALWAGWKSLMSVAIMAFEKEKTATKDFRPYYVTIVSLGNALLDLRQLARDGQDRVGALQYIGEHCPRTMQAIQTMPRVEDGTQMGSFLRGSRDF